MRTVVVLLVACIALASAAEFAQQFEDFKMKFGREYPSAAEEAKRFRIFVQNMKKATELQALNPLAEYGVNKFADVSEEEFKVRLNSEAFYEIAMKSSKNEKLEFSEAEVRARISQIDWRTKGAVTGVKDQGHCGSCWAFSATGSIEGQWMLAGHPLTSVSEQLLVSCDHIDHGCSGGLMDHAFQWIIEQNKGEICTEASYPYASAGGVAPACQNTGKTFGAAISSWQDLAHDEAQLATFVGSRGPLAIGVDATSFQTYKGGIVTNCISSRLNHGVLIVGYDEEFSTPYWVIKNSWGTGWGESGYIRVKKGSNQCMITSYPTTAIAKNGPTPTSPTTSPAHGTFTEKTCKDMYCNSCEEETMPQATCINGDENDSFIGICIERGLLMTSFTEPNCKGTSHTSVQQLDVCEVIFENHTRVFVVRHCNGGPSPTTPTPTTPAPANKTFAQKHCSDSQCTLGCQSQTFPQGVCLRLSGGGSAIAECSAAGLTLKIYTTSGCTGSYTTNTMPVNKCLQSSSGGYFENICNNGAAALSTGTLHTL